MLSDSEIISEVNNAEGEDSLEEEAELEEYTIPTCLSNNTECNANS